jgi:regulator of protease activity HflC (stomatin/prohibitin superfamily)
MGLTNKETQLALTKAALPNPNAPRLNVVAAMLFLFPLLLGVIPTVMFNNPFGLIIGLVVGLLLAQAPKVAKQWEKAVVLRLGRYVGIRGPGLFWIVPLIETVSSWIDQRIITTNFVAEQTLTSDTVPVNVDAVLFWMVYDPE